MQYLYKSRLVLYNLLMKLILASNSPRRRELLTKLGYEFEVIPSIGEEISHAASPVDMVKELACHKALNVYSQNRDAIVIGCDTVVDLDGVVLGKPRSEQIAKDMLKCLSGRIHKVHTGVCILSQRDIRIFSETSYVKFYELDEERIASYVASGSPMDKAGAYGIQDSGFVAEIKGSYTNVMGLPTERLDKLLKQIAR